MPETNIVKLFVSQYNCNNCGNSCVIGSGEISICNRYEEEIE